MLPCLFLAHNVRRPLLFLNATLHGKKARAHHIVKPFRICDECEAAVARVQCAPCAGKQSEPLIFCADCSCALHSKKARVDHQVELISSSSSFVTNAAVQNDCKAGEAQGGDSHMKTEAMPFTRTEKGTVSVEFEESSLPSTKQGPQPTSNVEATCLSGSVGASKKAATGEEGHIFNVRIAPQHGNPHRNTLDISEDDALRLHPSLHATSPKEAHASTNEKSFQKIEVMNTCSELVGENKLHQVSLAGVEISSREKAAQISTKKVSMHGMEGIGLTCPTAKMCETAPVQKSMLEEGSRATRLHEAMQNETEGPLFGNMEVSMNQQHHGIVSSETQKATKSTPLNEPTEASQAGSPATITAGVSHLIFTTQGVHPPIQYAQPHYSHHACSPHGRHCSYQNMFQGSHTPPPSQNHLYPSYQNMFQGSHTPPPSQNHLYPHCTPLLSMHHMADGMWPVRALDFSQNALHSSPYNGGCVPPPCQSCAPVNAQGYMPFSSQVRTGFTAQVDCPSSQYTPQIAQHGNSDSIHSKSDNQHAPTSNKRVRSISNEMNAVAPNDIHGIDCDTNISKRMHVGESMMCAESLNQVHNERTRENLLRSQNVIASSEGPSIRSDHPSLEGLSSLGKDDTDGSLGQAAGERDLQNTCSGTGLSKVNPSRKDCGSTLESNEPSASELGGSIAMEKLATDTPSQSAEALPNLPLEKDLPAQGQVSDLVHKLVPVENGPVKEFHLKKDETENLSVGVILEAVSSGNASFDSWSNMATAIHRPKQELLDNYPEEAGPLEFAACTLLVPDASPDGGLENAKGTTWFAPKQDSNVPKRPRNRHRKMHVNSPIQPTHNPLLDRGNIKESSSRESSEPSYHNEDSSAEDETFHAKKYRRGSITLEAFARIDDGHDATGHIYSVLKRGLRCSTPDEDARQALKNAQRKVTKANLKQAGAREGSLQNAELLILGSCAVDFVSTGLSQRGCLDLWTHSLAQTVAKYFATECCSQKLKVIFYGVEQNANCAAVAFAAIFNRISIFSADYIPEKLLDAGDLVEIDRNWECSSKGVFSRRSRMAYRNELTEALFKIPRRQRDTLRTPRLESIKSVNNVSVFATHAMWIQGIPKHSSLVKRYGHEAIEALIMHCEKACRKFVDIKGWTIIASRLRDPVFWKV
ncbi:hypothetical protein GOP47_0027355 [Adiantum capillus-veneris]|nr:hypothetical protein GOP47_0027355 [Adiantum capillus-veneris]